MCINFLNPIHVHGCRVVEIFGIDKSWLTFSIFAWKIPEKIARFMTEEIVTWNVGNYSLFPICVISNNTFSWNDCIIVQTNWVHVVICYIEM